MSHHNVTIHQLGTEGFQDAYRPFLNVITEWGALGVWGTTFAVPVYLLRGQGDTFALMTFTTEATAAEWLEQHKQEWTVAQKLWEVSRGA